MNLYDLMSPIENKLADKAAQLKHPLGGTLELSPLCNMNCRMCFIRQDPSEIAAKGRILDRHEWLCIAREMKEAGVLYLLLTGGEPLLYPYFNRLYCELLGMGFIITINTNGTLIDERWADFFAQMPCRRLNITLYGTSDAEYEALCGNPKGYTRVMHALSLLKERGIPFCLNFTVTRESLPALARACEIAKAYEVEIRVNEYLFPPIRRDHELTDRVTPEEAAQALIDSYCYQNGRGSLPKAAINTLMQLTRPNKSADIEGITCRAGTSGFWAAWNGDLLPCGMFTAPAISLLENHFPEAWNYITEETAKLRMYDGCRTCDKRNICHVCAAACLTESHGDMTKRPDYVCAQTQAYYRKLLEG